MPSSAQSNLQGSAPEKAPTGKLRAFASSFPKFHRRQASEPPSIHATAGADSKSIDESRSDGASSEPEELQPSSSSRPEAGEEQVTNLKEARGMPQGTVRRIAERNPNNPLEMRPVAPPRRSGFVPRSRPRGVGDEPDRNTSQRAKPYSREVNEKKTASKPTEPALGALASLFKALAPTRLE
ncbi:hypothetical protein FRC01_003243 [Tulasnella sp. 417]|nr:hypothetical protein FRC01_003243 [Tulasnella sp. 417]